MTQKNDHISERRTKLDGGLNTHDNPYQVEPSQVVELSNFRADEGGSLKLRDAAKFLQVVSTETSVRLPAAVIVDAGAGGTIPAATYTCRYHNTRWGSSSVTGDIGASTSSNALVLGANRQITIRIFPLNLGEGVGQSAPIDDPYMGGYSSAQVAIYLQSGAGAFEFQGLKAFTWDAVNVCWSFTLTSYTTGQGTSSDENNYLPVRKLMYFDAAQGILGVFGDQVFSIAAQSASGVPATISSPWGRDVDKNSNTFHPFSRHPTPIDNCVVGRVMIATDGFRPKKVHVPSSLPTVGGNGRWRMLGANPPDAAPTMAAGAAGNPNGTYSYRITFVYQHSRPTSRSAVENWYSESRPTQSAGTVVAANQQITVTFNANRNETGLYRIHVYRTVNGGSTYYFVGTSSTGSFVDNVADANLLTGRTDPDDEGKIPCDVPPQRLILVARLGQRCIGVVGQPDYSASFFKVVQIRGTNQARVSKPQAATYLDPATAAGQLDGGAESSIDAWPNDANHTIVCGGDEEITALVTEYRGLTYVFKYNEIGIISGREPGEFDYQTLYTEIGAIRDSVVNVKGLLFFWNAEKGAYTFDGRSYQWIGYPIHDNWLADRDANLGYYCVNAIHDPEVNEVRWSFTNAGLDPVTHQLDATQSNLPAVRGTYKEYAYNLDSQSWWPMSGTNQTRDVRAVCLARVGYSTGLTALRYRVIFGTTIGTLCQDHETGANAYRDPITGSTGEAITAFATLKFAGFLDDWEQVKQYQMVFTAFTMGTPTSGSLVVKVRAAQSANFVTAATISAATVGTSRVQKIPVPAAIGDSISQSRGLQVRFESTLNCALSIQGVEVQYRPVTDRRAEERP